MNTNFDNLDFNTIKNLILKSDKGVEITFALEAIGKLDLNVSEHDILSRLEFVSLYLQHEKPVVQEGSLIAFECMTYKLIEQNNEAALRVIQNYLQNYPRSSLQSLLAAADDVQIMISDYFKEIS